MTNKRAVADHLLTTDSCADGVAHPIQTASLVAGEKTAEQIARPSEPELGHDVWYRGWECGYDVEAALWVKEGWRAYKGGADLDAPNTSARTFSELLDEIDAEEDEA